MYIVMTTPELAPVAKVGGLADVVFGLSRELEIRGNSVEIILPKYDCMRYDQIWGLTNTFQDLWVPWYNGAIHCSVWFGFVQGRKCFFIDPHYKDEFFNRKTFYGCHDDVMRFAFFSKAVLEFMLKSDKRPDIIHVHDWQTALVPVLLAEMYQHTGMSAQRVCYTIHNFKHQGVTGGEILAATGLGKPEHFFRYEQMRDNHNPSALNLSKGGIVYSNFVTTVSPQHAWEARFTDQSHGLGPTLNVHQGKFGGILNGVDYDVWNPELDNFIPARYSINNLDDKYKNKDALRDRFWLRKEYKPIISYVGRLDDQKGVHLIHHAAYYAIQHGAQFILLGSASSHRIGSQFDDLKRQLNNSPDCHIELGFNEELSHLIYAGSDILIVPSLYEPCGLTQMIALRYGTVPVVRAVGGLVNTVFDKDYSDRSWEDRNGFVFNNPDFPGINSALDRSISLWHSFPDDFRQLMTHGMRYDFSWKHPGNHYLAIYEHIRHK
jgi:starch synthase